MIIHRSNTYLKFLARLYELAADFDRVTLSEIERTASNENNELVCTMASLLKDFHGERATRSDSGSKKKTTAYTDEGLREILSSKTIFPSNKVLSAFARSTIDLPERPKDSRNRLVTRILRATQDANSKNRALFRRRLKEYIADQNGSSNFVSQWTQIIQDL